MSTIAIRRVVSTRDEIYHEGGAPRSEPLLVGTIAVALENPYAGSYFDDILPFMEELKELGKDLAGRLVELLAVEPSAIEAYGKGAIVGVDGELEHGALWHQPGGWGMREVLGGTKAIVFSNKRVGPAGTRLHIPMGHVNAAYVRSHMSSAEVGMDDAPRPSEIVFALVMSTGPRIHARVGGLAASEIKGEDGQR